MVSYLLGAVNQRKIMILTFGQHYMKISSLSKILCKKLKSIFEPLITFPGAGSHMFLAKIYFLKNWNLNAELTVYGKEFKVHKCK